MQSYLFGENWLLLLRQYSSNVLRYSKSKYTSLVVIYDARRPAFNLASDDPAMQEKITQLKL